MAVCGSVSASFHHISATILLAVHHRTLSRIYIARRNKALEAAQSEIEQLSAIASNLAAQFLKLFLILLAALLARVLAHFLILTYRGSYRPAS